MRLPAPHLQRGANMDTHFWARPVQLDQADVLILGAVPSPKLHRMRRGRLQAILWLTDAGRALIRLIHSVLEQANRLWGEKGWPC